MVDMVTRGMLICDSCRKLYMVEVYHAGFSQIGFLYCDKDSTVVTWGPITDITYYMLVGKKLPWSLDRKEQAVVEDALKPCPCGGRFRFDNNLRCPSCGEPLSGGMSKQNIYMHILDRHIDGEKVDIWKSD
jgi:hypothetical protein